MNRETLLIEPERMELGKEYPIMLLSTPLKIIKLDKGGIFIIATKEE